MLQSKEPTSALCFAAAESLIGRRSMPQKAEPPKSSHESVLQDLFLARLDCSILPERCTNERPKRSNPFMTMSSPSLFESRRKELDLTTSSLFHQLGQQTPLKAKDCTSSKGTASEPFPWHSALFTAPSTSNNNTSSSMTGDLQLDQHIRSFSNSLRATSSTLRNKKRPRNQATRYRFVGQAMGQKGVQSVVATVKQVKQLQCEARAADATAPQVQNLLKDTVLVDAWENTPLDDLKSLPWEEMLQTSLKHVEAYKAWKEASQD